MTTCLACAHSALRDFNDHKKDELLKPMAAMGLINCLKSPARGTFHRCDMPACRKYEPAAPETIAARQRWAQKAA